MKMTLISTVLAVAVGGAAHAGMFSSNAPMVGTDAMPPDGYEGQWWTHPSGCEYSRAGRPGEIVWYVIVNSIGRKQCPVMIVQKAYPGAYQGLGGSKNRTPGGLL